MQRHHPNLRSPNRLSFSGEAVPQSAGNVAVFDGVVMDVIDVAAKIVFVLQRVLPKSALPDAAFTFAATAGADVFGFGNVSGKSGLDQHPAGWVIGVAGRQGENGV